jgi:hypothetical protein
MEDNRRTPERALQRRFEGNRLEEELWTAAYASIRPVIRRSLKPSGEQWLSCPEACMPELIARRA